MEFEYEDYANEEFWCPVSNGIFFQILYNLFFGCVFFLS